MDRPESRLGGWRGGAGALVLLVVLLAGRGVRAQDEAAGGAKAQGPPRPVLLNDIASIQVRWLPLSASGAAAQALAAGGAELDRVLGWYNYDRHAGHWDIQQLQCPLLHSSTVLKFEMTDRGGLEAAFVAWLGSGAEAPPVAVVPLRQNGRAQAAIGEDPHNLAIFNEWIASEHPALKTYGDWMTLPLLYLAMAGVEPQVLDATNAARLLGATPHDSYLPLIEAEAGGMAVEFYDYRSAQDVIGWDFDFQAGGQMFLLARRDGDKANLPRGRFR